jgi:hypothetical protein
MRRKFAYLILFIMITLSILAFSNLGPTERSLGSHVRLVYLHGAWVWTALLGFLFAAVFGLLGLFSNQISHHAWSVALGQTGLFFWVTYLPLSLWTMQMNWNGIFFQEPRWKVSFDFAVVALLIQLAIVLMNRPTWGSFLNLVYFIVLSWALIHTEQVMHPGSPITTSGSTAIQSFFGFLLLLCLLAGWSLTNWFRSFSFNPQ